MSDAKQTPVVWSEIPVSNLGKAIEFYGAVTGHPLTRQTMGPNDTAILGGRMESGGGHLYEGAPSGGGAGPTVHLACAGALEEAIERTKAAGGTVISEPIPLPEGRFAYATDPDGNSIGLFEAT